MVKLNKLYLIIIFFIFAFIRFFVNFEYFLIYSDSLRYLTLAKYFPYHLYFNKSFYVLHPPLFPYFIHIFNFFISKDYIAAILVSFFFSLISFIVLVKLFYLLKKNIYWIAVFMLFFTFNLKHFFFSTDIVKESMAFALLWLTIYFFIKGLKKINFNFIYSGIFSIMLILTTDLAVVIFPIFILTFIFFFNWKKIIPALFSFLSALTAWLFWILLKLKIYLNNTYYPIASNIENVTNFNLLQLYNPAFFPTISNFAAFHFAPTIIIFIKHIRYFFCTILNIIPPFNIPIINPSLFGLREYLLLIFIYLPIIFFMFITITKTIINLFKRFEIRDNLNLYFILLSIILLLPVTQIGSSSRFSFPVIVPFFFFITEGIFMFINKLKLIKIIKHIPLIVISLLCIFLPFWIINNPYPIISLKSEIVGGNMANYIKNLDGDGVMAKTVPITYFTNKREISPAFFPEELDFFIDLYRIKYITFLLDENNPYLEFYKKTFDYIFEHPEKYKLLKIIEEKYHPNNNDELIRTDIKNKFYVFLVFKNHSR